MSTVAVQYSVTEALQGVPEEYYQVVGLSSKGHFFKEGDPSSLVEAIELAATLNDRLSVCEDAEQYYIYNWLGKLV